MTLADSPNLWWGVRIIGDRIAAVVEFSEGRCTTVAVLLDEAPTPEVRQRKGRP